MSKRWTEKSGFQWEHAGEGFSNTWLTPPELVEPLGACPKKRKNHE